MTGKIKIIRKKASIKIKVIFFTLFKESVFFWLSENSLWQSPNYCRLTHNPYFSMDILLVASMDFYFKEKEYVISQQVLLLLKGCYTITD